MVDQIFPTDFTDVTSIDSLMKLLGDDGTANGNVPVDLLRSYILAGANELPMKAALTSKSADQTGLTGGNNTITFDGTIFDDYGFADLSNNRFEVKEDGIYLFGAHAQLLLHNPSEDAYIAPSITSSLTQPASIRWTRDNHDLATPGMEGSVILKLQAGDTVQLQVFGDSDGFTVRSQGAYMFLVKLTQSSANAGGWTRSSLLTMSADQTTGFAPNDPVQFDQVDGDHGLSGNQITIKANETAMLTAQVAPRVAATTDSVVIRWWDVTNGAWVGRPVSYFNVGRTSTTVTPQAVLVARVSPTVDTLYELRIVSVVGTVNSFDDAETWAKIESVDPGKAVIVHQGADDLTSQPSGAAGARIACGGVIEK